MKKSVAFILFLPVSFLFAENPVILNVWPDGAPESNEITEPERTNEEGHIFYSQEARLYVYRPDSSQNTGTAVLICPGGGYSILAIQHEGCGYAEWLASQGITGAVLKYRMPNGHCSIPLSDAQEAMRILRKQAPAWHIDPGKIGVSGFSAGGHLASTLGTHFDPSCRPAFMILFYPVVTMQDFTHEGSKIQLLGNKKEDPKTIENFSNERQVRPDTPPALIFLSDDDRTVVPENSIAFYRSLKENRIPASLYIFPEGKHGWGMNPDFPYHETWKKLLTEWLKQGNFLDRL